jgi:hypothetical protein
VGDMSEWLKVMLEEIDRKEAESREEQAPTEDDKQKGVPVRPDEGGEKEQGGEKRDR